MLGTSLTGEIKFRRSLFGKQILQVQVRHIQHPRNGPCFDTWRDAHHGDLINLKLPA